MKILVVFALLVGSISSAPAKLEGLVHHHHHHDDTGFDASDLDVRVSSTGYEYPEPAIPSGLYNLPDIKPPKEPSGLYEAPELPQPSDTIVVVQESTTTTTPKPQIPGESVQITDVLKPMEMLMPYKFDWGVQDQESGNMFTHTEDSDGANVSGEYRVLLPDNRLQIVRFRSDPVKGYQADVTYEQV